MEYKNPVSLGSIKQGATFSYTIELDDKNTGLPLPGMASRLKCHGKYIGDESVLVEVTISETSELGVYLLFVSSALTKTWRPKSTILFDILYAPPGAEIDPVDITDTLSIFVEESMTRG
jgi:hypothetical protein